MTHQKYNVVSLEIKFIETMLHEFYMSSIIENRIKIMIEQHAKNCDIYE